MLANRNDRERQNEPRSRKNARLTRGDARAGRYRRARFCLAAGAKSPLGKRLSIGTERAMAKLAICLSLATDR